MTTSDSCSTRSTTAAAPTSWSSIRSASRRTGYGSKVARSTTASTCCSNRKDSSGRTGYVVEIALPFSSLRAASDPASAWGLHIFRKIRHFDDAEVSWRPLERGRARLLEQEGRINGFVETAPPRRLEIIPTLTLSREDGPAATNRERTDPEGQLGGTLRWAVGQAIVVDAAIRPDFAQVEADQPVVTANQRFPLFFPEKRPFFLEGNEIFQTPLAVLNTRTILDPEFAVKATGKRGSTTAGVLVARDEGPARAIADAAGNVDAADLAIVRVQRELGDRAELGRARHRLPFLRARGRSPRPRRPRDRGRAHHLERATGRDERPP